MNNYWKDIDYKLEKLLSDGYVKLPSLVDYDLDAVSQLISNDMPGRTFSELNNSHKSFLDVLEVDKYLKPKLFKLAKSNFNYEGNFNNEYHIARKVDPGNSKEMYRAHFDSHLFTIVLPLKIPNKVDSQCNIGELIFVPNARKSPKNEITNFVSKLWHKKYASKSGIEKYNATFLEESFEDYCPILFIGNSTLHTNKPVSSECDSYRLTLLAHYFDPSPKYGIGSLLRALRSR